MDNEQESSLNTFKGIMTGVALSVLGCGLIVGFIMIVRAWQQ